MRGMLIALEGGEASGKTTQTELLRKRMADRGYNVIAVKEPGSTTLGEHLREYLKSKRAICREAEILMFQAARAQLVNDTVRPNLEAGIHVISDRFTGSTTAYQGYGRGIGLDLVDWLNGFATAGLEPDLNILLHTGERDFRARIGDTQGNLFAEPGPELRMDAREERRFEDLPGNFHRRVIRGYEELAKTRSNWRRVDGTREVEEVAAAVWHEVAVALSERARTPDRAG